MTKLFVWKKRTFAWQCRVHCVVSHGGRFRAERSENCDTYSNGLIKCAFASAYCARTKRKRIRSRRRLSIITPGENVGRKVRPGGGVLNY